MRVLIDTNVFLWCLAGETVRLSRRAKRLLESDETELVLSAVSLWEIAVKAQAGKLQVPQEGGFFQEHMALLGVQTVLPVEATHVFALFGLPRHHRDPFDRLLAAQCVVEKLPLVASDRALRRYPIEVIW